MPNDDGRHGRPLGEKAQCLLPIRRIEIALGETDPTGSESLSVRGKHQVLGNQGAVFDDPWTWRIPRNQDEHWRVVEDLKNSLAEQRLKVAGVGSCLSSGEHPSLGFAGNSLQQRLVAYHRKRPLLGA
jgi:hypothetical protein